ncbi:MAG: hypothetical protein KME54_29420 [Tolypothrix brevis GSE-NOS-MK-07-07A]|jgi:hypothetical protein|nr:hypothetical protein [Tolypothrix brevis GSE-NOS-MK-07-07A]
MSQENIDSKVYREFGSCFYLVVPICENDDEFNALMEDAKKVEQATTRMLQGSINIEELIESIEGFVPCIDSYLEEIEDNMNESLIKIYRY